MLTNVNVGQEEARLLAQRRDTAITVRGLQLQHDQRMQVLVIMCPSLHHGADVSMSDKHTLVHYKHTFLLQFVHYKHTFLLQLCSSATLVPHILSPQRKGKFT